jgi:hypothetical protein
MRNDNDDDEIPEAKWVHTVEERRRTRGRPAKNEDEREEEKKTVQESQVGQSVGKHTRLKRPACARPRLRK